MMTNWTDLIDTDPMAAAKLWLEGPIEDTYDRLLPTERLMSNLAALCEAPITVEVVKGIEGLAIYLNGERVAGPKPWGGGRKLIGWNGAIPAGSRRFPEVK